jgi:hypothetical protein
LKLDKIINNITDIFNAAAGDVDGAQKPDRASERQADRTRYQEMKRRYELHDTNSYLPNTRDNMGNYSKYVGESCTSAGCVLS